MPGHPNIKSQAVIVVTVFDDDSADVKVHGERGAREIADAVADVLHDAIESQRPDLLGGAR